MCISPEAARQIGELSGDVKGQVIQFRPQYGMDRFAALPDPDWSRRPFTLLFAGRLERNKGVFDVVDAVERLRDRVPGGVALEICGTGGAEGPLIDAIHSRGLAPIVRWMGQRDRAGMFESYGRCHCVLTPTTSACAEGLNRVTVEGVLAGRPVIASDVCPAAELLRPAIVEVPAGDAIAIAEAILLLASDRCLYERKRQACQGVSEPFYDAAYSWGSGAKRAIMHACGTRE
jgi:glycosyltransferase involved in cell wall biosynthesis